jgi:hypothetical protein
MVDPYSYIKYKNQDPSIEPYSESTVIEILDIIDDKINKDIFKKYKINPRAVLAQDFAHAVVRKLSWKLLTRVKNIDEYEKHNVGDIRNIVYVDDDDHEDSNQQEGDFY